MAVTIKDVAAAAGVSPSTGSRTCKDSPSISRDTKERVRRIMARDGIPEAYARLRVRAQKDEAFYRAHCTDVLVNDCGSAAAFTEKARQALETILKEERA